MTDKAPKATAAGHVILRAAALPDAPHSVPAFIVLCHLPHNKVTPYATWQMNEPDRSTYWGHYLTDLDEAHKDFAARCTRKGGSEVSVSA